jgi:hypothetical protein
MKLSTLLVIALPLAAQSIPSQPQILQKSANLSDLPVAANVVPPAANASPAPQKFWIATGGSFVNGSPKWGGLVTFGYQLTANTYSYTTETVTVAAHNALASVTGAQPLTALRTGVMSCPATIGNLMLCTAKCPETTCNSRD